MFAARMNGKSLPIGTLVDPTLMDVLNLPIEDEWSDDNTDDEEDEAGETEAPKSSATWDYVSEEIVPGQLKRLSYVGSLKRIFGGRNTLTTLLLLLLWLVSAFVYFGLVLLTTSLQVSCPTLHSTLKKL